jgi:hypothetical protein
MSVQTGTARSDAGEVLAKDWDERDSDRLTLTVQTHDSDVAKM